MCDQRTEQGGRLGRHDEEDIVHQFGQHTGLGGLGR